MHGKTTVPILPWGHAFWNGRLYIGGIKSLEISLQFTRKLHRQVEVTVTNPNTFFVTDARLNLHRVSSNASGANQSLFMQASLGLVPPLKTVTIKTVMIKNGNFSPRGFRPTDPLRGQIHAYLVGMLSQSPGIVITPGGGFKHDNSYLESRHSFLQRVNVSPIPMEKEIIDHFFPKDTPFVPPATQPGR
ncbi:MAG: hypothetical protein ACI9R3_005442 [Verrucomicrobiales bacterium]|jgi:hypothetical protein